MNITGKALKTFSQIINIITNGSILVSWASYFGAAIAFFPFF